MNDGQDDVARVVCSDASCARASPRVSSVGAAADRVRRRRHRSRVRRAVRAKAGTPEADVAQVSSSRGCGSRLGAAAVGGIRGALGRLLHHLVSEELADRRRHRLRLNALVVLLEAASTSDPGTDERELGLRPQVVELLRLVGGSPQWWDARFGGSVASTMHLRERLMFSCADEMLVWVGGDANMMNGVAAGCGLWRLMTPRRPRPTGSGLRLLCWWRSLLGILPYFTILLQ